MPGKSKLSISLRKEIKCSSYDPRKLEVLNCSQSGIDWDEDSRLLDEDDYSLQKPYIILESERSGNVN